MTQAVSLLQEMIRYGICLLSDLFYHTSCTWQHSRCDLVVFPASIDDIREELRSQGVAEFIRKLQGCAEVSSVISSHTYRV